MEIKISQESLDAFKKEKELIPAPIDDKNVTTDWIEDVFDHQSCVWGEKKSAVGYINGEPVIAAWDMNMMLWQFPLLNSIEDTIHLSVLKDRLNYWREDSRFVEDLKVVGNLLMQKFYWKNEDLKITTMEEQHYSIFIMANKRGVLGWTLMKFDGRIYWTPSNKWYSSYNVARKMRDRLNLQLKGKSA